MGREKPLPMGRICTGFCFKAIIAQTIGSLPGTQNSVQAHSKDVNANDLGADCGAGRWKKYGASLAN